ncbi:MAG: hypothetical protein U0625_00135 [Phycisphaerales bacterium]
MKKRADYKRIATEDALIEGLTEALEVLDQGERLEDRFTMRTVELNLAPQPLKSKDVRAIRAALTVSQSVFAHLIGVSVKTVQSWEQGTPPPPMACRLLGLIAEDPKRWTNALGASRRASVTA